MFKKILFLILLFLLLPQKTFAAITFSISDPQYQGEEITVNVSLAGLTSASCPNGSCYLQGGFTATTGNPRYSGFTKNNAGNWYEYISSPETTYIQANFFSFQLTDGSWSGTLVMKANPNDPDYNGPGEYNLKMWRYTGNSSSGSASDNTLLVNISTSTPTPIPTAIPTSSPMLTPSPTKTPTPKPSTPKPTATPIATTVSISLTNDEEITESSVLSQSTPSSRLETIDPEPSPLETKVAAGNNFQKILIGVGILFIISSNVWFIKSLKKNE